MIVVTYGSVIRKQGFGVKKTRDGATEGSRYPPIKISGIATIPYPSPLVLAGGASINVATNGSATYASGTGGQVTVKVQISPADAGTWTDICSGTTGTITSTEPGDWSASGSFTNATGDPETYDIQVVVTRTGSGTLTIRGNLTFP